MNQVIVKTPQEIAIMREGGKKLIQIFKVIKNHIKQGNLSLFLFTISLSLPG